MKRSLFLVSTFVLSFAAHAGEFRLKDMTGGRYQVGHLGPAGEELNQFQRIKIVKVKLDIALQDKEKSPEKLNQQVIADMGRDMRLLKDGEKTEEVARVTFQVTKQDNQADPTQFNFVQFFEHKIVSKDGSAIADDTTPRYCHTAIFYDVLNERTGEIRARAYMLENDVNSKSHKDGFLSFQNKDGRIEIQ